MDLNDLLLVSLVLVALWVLAIGLVILTRRRERRSAAPVDAPPAPKVASPAPEVAPPAPKVAPPAPKVAPPPVAQEPSPPAPEVVPPPRQDDGVTHEGPVSIGERTGRTRELFTETFGRIKARRGVPPETWDDLEETMLRADIGVRLVDTLLAPLRESVRAGRITTADGVIEALREQMTGVLSGKDRSLCFDPGRVPNIWLFVGVNGVGKTTTIGKVGAAQTGQGRSVLMAAGDTFRAAAAEQLATWAGRCGADFVRGSEGGDPASVIFDAGAAAAARGIDLVLADTAGRLQNKSNLMEELRKVRRVADKSEGSVTEVLLVIDATTGQNGLSQAREFAAATDVTGIVLTKLDGSAKGGIAFAIESELAIPVKLVGLGETVADLTDFDPQGYVSGLLG